MLMNGTQQLRFNFRLKFRSRTIHFDSLIARGKSHQGVYQNQIQKPLALNLIFVYKGLSSQDKNFLP